MNILYCGDKGIEEGTLVSVLSLAKYNTEPLEIYIATIAYDDVKPFTKKAAKLMDKIVKQKNKQSFVKLIDATEIFVENLPKKNMNTRYTPCSMLRLYADKMPELADCKRVLYLDYDVVCRGDIAKFYHMNLDNIEAAGVLDIYGRHFYRYHGIWRRKDDPSQDLPAEERGRSVLKHDYMNSGVMLFNMVECRKTRVFERAARFCVDKWMLLADQSALNRAIDRRKLVPRKYNEQAERPRSDTVLHHFSMNIKLWPYFHLQKVKPHNVDKIHEVLGITEYDDILEEFLRLKQDL